MIAPLAPLASPGEGLLSFDEVPIAMSAALLVDAYRGTVDWSEGDDEVVAQQELATATSGHYGQYLPEASFSVVDETGEPMAQILCCLIDSTPTILFVYTAAVHKGQGHAAKLIRAAAWRLEQAGYQQLALYVTDSNPALSLYEKLGFMPMQSKE